jgi:hypothetical protein
VFRAALAKVCAEAGTAIIPVTGPGSQWDFKLKASGATAFVATVTEYHEGKGRLVRVRCSRASFWNFLAARRFHALLHQAAEDCGWLDEDHSRDSENSTLAGLPSSTKLPEHAP